MAYKTQELIEQSLKAIQENDLVFIDDVVSFLPCSTPTFYKHKLHNNKDIISALYNNRLPEANTIHKINVKHNGSGYIYLINCIGTNYYKIGISKIEPNLRLSSLQSGCPFDLRFIELKYCENYKEEERRLHRKYQSKQKRGEWFDFSADEMVEVLDEYESINNAIQYELVLN